MEENLIPAEKRTVFRGLIGERLKSFFAKDYWQSRIVLWLLAASFMMNIINWLMLVIFVRPSVPTIILHYNVYFGVDVMGHRGWAYLLPAIGIFLLLINNFLASYFYSNKERIASYVLLITSLMIQLSLIIASISVIIINY